MASNRRCLPSQLTAATPLCALLALLLGAEALDDGLCRTPVMGMNSWTAFGKSVTAQDLIDVGKFFVSSGLRDKGYKWVNTDDGWSLKDRDPTTGRIQPDLTKFPQGISGLVKELNAMNLSFGIYTAESSVVCGGAPGSLFHEHLDAQTFAEWGVGLVKNDNCGEYSYGNARFHVFADAVAATGRDMIISTEPFSLIPNPNQARFAHYWRTGNDISANWNVILNRIDQNDKWAPFAGPGHFNDPDMLQVGNGVLTTSQQRAHFALWAITKSTLILGTRVTALSAEQLAIIGNKDLIAINQDPLGVQAKKVAINGTLAHQFVGLAPCAMYEADAGYPDAVPGPNGVTKAGMVFHTALLDTDTGAGASRSRRAEGSGPLADECVTGYSPNWQSEAGKPTGTAVGEVVWHNEACDAGCATQAQCKAICKSHSAPVYDWMFEKQPGSYGCRCYTAAQRAAFTPVGSGWTMCDGTKTAPPTAAPTPLPTFALVANETGRCIGLREYAEGRTVPLLLACDPSDKTQAWQFPTGADRIGAVQSAWAAANGNAATVLSVANSTLFGSSHGPGEQALLDQAFGEQWLELAAYAPEPACDNRNCQDYDPSQSWYWSPRSGTVRLATANAEGYRCYEPGCYHLTSHLPAIEEFCLARVASISYYGTDPASDKTGGTDVYAGPLSSGAFVFGLLNRNGGGSANITAQWSFLETEGFGEHTRACVKELFSGKTMQATGGTSWIVPAHDIAVLRVVPGAVTC